MKITVNIAPETYLNILRAASNAIAYWGTPATRSYKSWRASVRPTTSLTRSPSVAPSGF